VARRSFAVVVMVGHATAIGAGCSGDEGSSVPGGSVSAGNYPALFAEKWCEKTSTCCATSGGTVGATCRSEVEADQRSEGDAARAQGASFDAGAAADCLARIDGAVCGLDPIALRDLVRTCDVWDGVVAPGGACSVGAACREEASTGAGCVGGRCVMIAVVPVGGPCITPSADMICEPLISECDSATSTCVALPAPGAPCSTDCRPGATCGTDGKCTALGGEGDACSDSNACMSDLCAAGRCVSMLAGDHCSLPQ
jgi:hypothetical protein